VGIAAEDLQRLRYAADLSGLSAEALDKSIASVAVGMSDLATGTDATAKALRAIGAQAGEDVPTTLGRIADQFEKMPDGIAKTNLAIDLFGKKIGPDLIPFLNAGSKGIKETAQELDKLGGVFTGGVLQVAEDFNDNLSRIERSLSSLTKQITAGMLPALAAMAEDFKKASENGDSFVKSGDRIGDVLIGIYKFSILAMANVKALGITLSGVADALTSPSQAKTILQTMAEDLGKVNDDANRRIAALAENLTKLKAAASGAGDRPAISGAADAALQAEEAAKAAKKLADEAAKAAKALDDLLRSLDPVGAAAKDWADKTKQANDLLAAGTIGTEQYQRIIDHLKDTYDLAGKAAKDASKEFEDLLRTLDPVGAKAADNAKKLEQLNAGFISGTIGVDAYTRGIETLLGVYDPMGKAAEEAAKRNQELIDSLDPAGAAAEKFFQKIADIQKVSEDVGPERTKSMEKQAREALGGDKAKDELKILEDGFTSFFDNLSSGAADFEDVFKRMVQSIIAELLKLWAKKYIVDAIAGAFGFGASPASAGAPVVATAAAPFTSVGVMSQSISPLTMGTDGGSVSAFGAASSSGLGLASEQQPMQVVINNNAPNVQVETQPTPRGLEVIISQVKASMTADILRGGNDVSHAAERAWGLSRGSAAAF